MCGIKDFFPYVSLGKTGGCGCCTKQWAARRQPSQGRIYVGCGGIQLFCTQPPPTCGSGDNFCAETVVIIILFLLGLKRGRSTVESGISHKTFISCSFAHCYIADISSYFSCGFGEKKGGKKEKEKKKRQKSLPLVFKELIIDISRQHING